MRRMRVAIIGQGKSGRNIHGHFFQRSYNKVVEVAAVVDELELRRQRAAEEFGCDVYEDYRELFGRNDIDLVINATFSHMHYSITKDLRQHGFNVLTEKPMARTYFECQDLMQTAKANNVLLTVFQQSLYNPHFKTFKKLIEEGKIGKVRQINLNYSGFDRRWDWQTLQAFCAGNIYNTGPHPIGQALSLLDWDDNAQVAFSKLEHVLSSGDSDDFVKVILTAPDKPVVDIEINSTDAFPNDYIYKAIGTYGTIVVKFGRYKIEYFEPDKAEERPVLAAAMSDENGYPAPCADNLEMILEKGDVTDEEYHSQEEEFYVRLHKAIMNNEPLDATAEKASKVIRVIETCHAMNKMPLIYHF